MKESHNNLPDLSQFVVCLVAPNETSKPYESDKNVLIQTMTKLD